MKYRDDELFFRGLMYGVLLGVFLWAVLGLLVYLIIKAI